MREFKIYIRIFFIYIKMFLDRIQDIILYDIWKKKRDDNLFGQRCYIIPATTKSAMRHLKSTGADLNKWGAYAGCIHNKEAYKRVKFGGGK